jgi:putative SOS response-associated peptidase YedK
MCGRFALLPAPDEVADVFGLIDLEDFPPRYNIAPTQPILIVTAGHQREPGSNLPERRSLLVRWGFIPYWAKDPKKLPLMINARSEEAIDKPAFRAAMRHRRVLVPTSGFYEWKKLGPKEKQPYWVRPRNGGVIAFAGLMETWHEPGGSEMDTAAILTTAANDDLKPIHDRMPVVIQEQDFARWLDCRNQEPRHVTDLLRPADPGFFEAIAVSDKVNSYQNMGPEVLEPALPRERPTPSPLKQADRPADQLDLF